jgi:ubiquitin C-terminal hydrolase
MKKKVTKKTQIQNQIEDSKLSDEEMAQLSWKHHLSMNDSIIVDLFQVSFQFY